MIEILKSHPIGPVIEIPPPPDELSFVDEEIAAMFRGKGGYFVGHPTMVQLVKELRLLREELAKDAK